MNKISKKLITKDHPDYETIGDYIHSKESVVGIDARHTHIAIIKKLTELEEKLDKLLLLQATPERMHRKEKAKS